MRANCFSQIAPINYFQLGLDCILFGFQVIQYILQAVEKTGAEPEVSLEEIDQALYTLQQARAARDSTGTTNNNINSHHEISSISSNCQSANNMPSANTIHVQGKMRDTPIHSEVYSLNGFVRELLQYLHKHSLCYSMNYLFFQPKSQILLR